MVETPASKRKRAVDDEKYGDNFAPKKRLKKNRGIARHRVQQVDKPDKELHTFPFLELPPEIRNKIYELSLTFDGKISWMGLPGGRYPDRYIPPWKRVKLTASSTKPNISLLVSNRQVYTEAVGLLYAQPLFLQSQSVTQNFLKAIGSSKCSLLRDINMRWDGNYGYSQTDSATLSLLNEVKHLAHLRITFYTLSLDGAERMARLGMSSSMFASIAQRRHDKLKITTTRFGPAWGSCYRERSMSYGQTEDRAD